MAEHKHDWILVTNYGDTRLMRFCQTCPERQMLSPDDWHKEQEQQLAEARALLEQVNDISQADYQAVSQEYRDTLYQITRFLAKD